MKYLKFAIFSLLIISFSLLILIFTTLWNYSPQLPSYEKIINYKPNLSSRIYSSDGMLLKSYYLEERIFIPIERVPENIKNALRAIDKVAYQTAPPTFENTVEALQNVGELLERNSAILFNLNSAETSVAIQQVTQQASPLLTQFQNDVRLNEALFERIKIIYENQETKNLSTEQQSLLEKEYKSFARNGALLNENEKELLREIDTEKAQLSLTFGENVLADTHAFELHITEEKDLEGLPEQIKEMAAELAQSKNKTGWVFTL